MTTRKRYYRLRRVKISGNASHTNLDEEAILLQDKTTIGRSEDADVQLVSQSNRNLISRKHATIFEYKSEGECSYYLSDHSLNGTYVNEHRPSSPVQLNGGDIIKFGHQNGYLIKAGAYAPQHSSPFTFVFEETFSNTVTVKHALKIIDRDLIIEAGASAVVSPRCAAACATIGAARDAQINLNSSLCASVLPRFGSNFPTVDQGCSFVPSTTINLSAASSLSNLPSFPSCYQMFGRLSSSFPSFLPQCQWTPSIRQQCAQRSALQSYNQLPMYPSFQRLNQTSDVSQDVASYSAFLQGISNIRARGQLYGSSNPSDFLARYQTPTSSADLKNDINVGYGVPNVGISLADANNDILDTLARKGYLHTAMPARFSMPLGLDNVQLLLENAANNVLSSTDISLSTSAFLHPPSDTTSSRNIKRLNFDGSVPNPRRTFNLTATSSNLENVERNRKEHNIDSTTFSSHAGVVSACEVENVTLSESKQRELINVDRKMTIGGDVSPSLVAQFPRERNAKVDAESNSISSQSPLLITGSLDEQVSLLAHSPVHHSPQRRGHGHSESSRSPSQSPAVPIKNVMKRAKTDETTRLLNDLTEVAFPLLIARSDHSTPRTTGLRPELTVKASQESCDSDNSPEKSIRSTSRRIERDKNSSENNRSRMTKRKGYEDASSDTSDELYSPVKKRLSNSKRRNVQSLRQKATVELLPTGEAEICAYGVAGCKKPEAEPLHWINCENCDEWFHTICAGLSHLSERQLDVMKFECTECASLKDSNTRKPIR